MKPRSGQIDCGSLGVQDVEFEFNGGKLVAVYFVWDREKVCNLIHDLGDFDILDIEEEYKEHTPDPFTLAKERLEDAI